MDEYWHVQVFSLMVDSSERMSDECREIFVWLFVFCGGKCCFARLVSVNSGIRHCVVITSCIFRTLYEAVIY